MKTKGIIKQKGYRREDLSPEHDEVIYEAIMTIDEYNTIYGAGVEPIIENTYECVIRYPQSDLDPEITGIPDIKNIKVCYTKIIDDDNKNDDDKE